jgi:hypothetical protein
MRGNRVGGALLLLPVAAALATGVLLPGPSDWRRLLLAGALWGLAGWAVFRAAAAALGGRWREMLLLTGGLAVALLAGEVALRALRPYESMPRFRWIASRRLHHVNPPGMKMFSGYVAGKPILVETNEDGLRTRHSRSEFVRHGVRIAVLGDSFVFGSGVNEEDAVPARLEKLLREGPGASDAAVLNAGVISYSPLLERRLFDDVVREYRPTLVVLFLDVTDVGDDFIYARKAAAGGPEPFALEGAEHVVFHGALPQLLEPWLGWLWAQARYPLDRVRAAQGRVAPADTSNYYLNYVEFEGRPENRYFIYRHALDRTEPFFDETLRHVEAIAKSAESIGARFALVVVPRYHHWSARECPQNWELGAYRTDEPFQYEYFRYFEERRAQAPFPIFDLLPAFRRTDAFPLVFPNDPHWNPDGHAFVARTLLEDLRGASLVR